MPIVVWSENKKIISFDQWLNFIKKDAIERRIAVPWRFDSPEIVRKGAVKRMDSVPSDRGDRRIAYTLVPFICGEPGVKTRNTKTREGKGKCFCV